MGTWSDNELLAEFPPDVFGQLASAATVVDLAAGDVLRTHRGSEAAVYLPGCGAISVLANFQSGSQAELTAVGREGAFGLFALLGVPTVPFVAEVTIPVEALRVPLAVFRRAFDAHPAVKVTVTRFLAGIFNDVVRTAGCYRFHAHEQWVARWLLTTADKARLETLPVTHEAVARRLGSPRHAVSATIAMFRNAGAVTSERGSIALVDRQRLQAFACSCYAPPLSTCPEVGMAESRSE